MLEQLDSVLKQRRSAPAHTSYVAGLYRAGSERMLEKIREEAVEVEEAARQVRDGDAEVSRLVEELADLWFHSLVLLHSLDGGAADILTELEGRFGVSGLAAKKNRTD